MTSSEVLTAEALNALAVGGGGTAIQKTGPNSFANVSVSGSSITVSTANGFAGSVTGGVITLSTTITGILKGNGTAISAGAAGDVDLILPTQTSNSGKFLTTDGTNSSWATVSGSGTVNSGTTGQIAYYASSTTAVSGNANLTISTAALTVGSSGVAGTLLLSGGTSGTTTLAVAATASGTLTLPAATDTLVGRATTDTLTNKTLTTPVINGTSTGTGVSATATASIISMWDANINMSANNFIDSLTSTVGSVSAITLVVGSAYTQVVTGGTAQTINLPVASTLTVGQSFYITNQMTNAAITVKSSGGTTVVVIPGNMGPSFSAIITCVVASGTTATSWSYTMLNNVQVTSAKTPAIQNTLTLAGTDGTTMTFPGATTTIAGLSTTQTFTGVNTFTPAVRASGSAAYFTITIPADTGQTAATESIGLKTVTGTRTWATTGTVGLQRENYLAGPTYASASASQTFTDAATLYIDKPIAGTNAVFTRGHSLVIVDSTSAASSITGGFVISTTLGTTATSVGIGNGNINAGGTLIVGGHVTLEGVTSTGATGTGLLVFGTSPAIALASASTAVTQSAGDNTTAVATDAFVTTAIANAIAGVNPAVAVQVATTAAGDTSGLTYVHVAGIGDTFTGAINTAITIDGHTLVLGDRVLVKNDTQTSPGAVSAGTFNGVYSVTTIQTVAVAPILTRALDYDTPSDINNTGAIPVVLGTANADTSWILTSSIAAVGTGSNALTYVQFSLAPSTIVTLTGSQALTNKTYNGNTWTAGTGTLTIAAGKTATVNNSITFAGTDSTTMTFPSTTATIARTDAANTFTGTQVVSLVNTTPQTLSVTTNAATADISHGIQNFTNSSAAGMTITLTTTSASDGQFKEIRIYDFSAVAEAITWVGTENSLTAAPTTSNGSTTLPLSVLFQFNGGTSKWRCVAST